MNARFYKTLWLCTGGLLLGIATSAQDVTGIWRGYFISDFGDQYKLEVQIGKNGKYFLQGVTYSYLRTEFYGKATATGNYNPGSKKVQIEEIKTVELKMSSGSVACIMKYLLQYSRSGNEEFLEGTFTSKYETTDSRAGIKRGGNCGGGTVFLRKVPTSDFYVEPFLRTQPTAKKPTATQPSGSTAKTNTKPPVNQKPAVKSPETNTTTKATTKTGTTPKKTSDTVKRGQTPVVKEEPKITTPKVEFKIPQVTRARQNELTSTLIVRNEEIVVRLYDNGEIDDDTISVYLDDKLLLTNKRLSATPITLKLKMDENNTEHVLVMVAENLGSIPPNTSLMIVQDGEKRYEVRITSTKQKNAMVRFRYQR